MPNPFSSGGFDDYAAEYDAALEKGISVSGEDKTFFARGRVAWLARCLNRLGVQPKTAMDFGCGIGSTAPFLFDLLGIESVVGVDVSPKSLSVATTLHATRRVRFLPIEEYEPAERLDLVFCNGVFHHIPRTKREAAVDYVRRSLRPGGVFALWENNAWNPGTRYVMSRIPFDRDAVTLTAAESRRLLSCSGFEIISTDYLFVFPAVLRWFRPIEPVVSRLPFGAQYQVLCRKR